MRPKLKEKRWIPNLEEEIMHSWRKKKTYAFDKKTEKPIFSIDTPPPYPSGTLAFHRVIHYSQIDVIARYKRMCGSEVLFPLGIDRNGLPVEVSVEKEFKITMRETPREEFLSLCRQFLDKHEKEIIWLFERLGLSCSSFEHEDIYRTDSPEYRRITQATFIELWNRGQVYVDTRPNNWCPVCNTTIADAEIEYKEEEIHLVYIKFRVLETGEDLVIATTRPELLPACAVVMVHPDDERYRHLHDKTAIVPLYDIRVPIIPHREARMEFGTGAVMTCSYGDYTDVRLFRDLALEPIAAISPDGKMTKAAGKYAGMTVREAKHAIIEDLKASDLIVKQEKTIHRTPTCWRSGNPIEFVAMPEYYLKQLDYKEDLRKIESKIKWFPKKHKQIFLNWLESITVDWPISRRRYYGDEIPLWYCKKCHKPIVPPPGEYYQPWKDPPPFDKCPYCDSSEFVGEERTFDTWFDSGISQLQILSYMRDEGFFKRAFPCSIRTQAKDIVRTWLYYSLLRTFQLLKKPAFKNIWLGGMVLDAEGRAMHTSLGNTIPPKPIIKKYGSDAIRLFHSLEASIGSDIRCSEERLNGAFKFLTKLWNVARFVSTFPVPQDGYEFTDTDRLVLAKLNETIRRCIQGYEGLDFQPPATSVRSFTWDFFASHFIESVKPRCYNRNGQFSTELQNGAWYTLHMVLKTILKLLAPICPFMTEKIYQQLYSKGESIHTTQFPQPSSEWELPILQLSDLFTEFNSAIWSFKKARRIALNAPITAVHAPEELSPFKRDLKNMHNIKTLDFFPPEDSQTFSDRPDQDWDQEPPKKEKYTLVFKSESIQHPYIYIVS
ncbi:MAG: valine--tRNA ligase [Promethearchaeota archaeon]